MHLPACNIETRVDILHDFIRSNPLGVLTTAIDSSVYKRLQSSHIPWILDSHVDAKGKISGVLRGHVAKQNPQAKSMMESLQLNTTAGAENVLAEDVLVLFNGPVHHYVTPHFYKETKPQTGKTVPTWDYEAVEVYGRARIYCDSKSSQTQEFLMSQLHDLSHFAETTIMGYGKDDASREWRVSDAPETYIALLAKNIIGIEIEMTSIEGRFKWSQEKRAGDRVGVMNGLGAIPGLGESLSARVRDMSEQYDQRQAFRGIEKA